MAKKLLLNRNAVPPIADGKLVQNGLLGYWNSKQGFNTTTKVWENLAPATKGKYNGTINGPVTLNADGPQFPGDNAQAHVLLPIPDELKVVTSATFEFRMNITNYAINPELFSREGTDVINGENYLMYITSERLLLSGIFDSLWADVRYSFTRAMNGELYITITVDSFTKFISVYINGVYLGGYAPTAIGLLTIGTTVRDTLRVGTTNDYFSPKGVLDNIRMYNRALNASEVAQNFTVRREIGLEVVVDKPIVANGLIGYWNSKRGYNASTKVWENIAPGTLGSYNGAINGPITLTANGPQFTSVGGPSNVAISTPFPGSTPITIEFFTNVMTTSSELVYFGTNEAFMGILANGATLRVKLVEENVDVPLPVPITTANGAYFSLVLDLANKWGALYQNGVKLIDGFVNTGTMFTKAMRLGGSVASTSPTGVIDNVRIYNRMLTEAEVTQNYNARRELGIQ